MIVRLHLHQQVDVLVAEAVAVAVGIGKEARAAVTGDYCSIVPVSRQHVFGRLLRGVTDHPEKRPVAGHGVDDPVGVEYLVPAVLRVGLGEHHQLDVRRVATQRLEALDQVVELVVRQGETEFAVGAHQGVAAAAQHVHRHDGPRLGGLEQAGRILELEEERLGHAVVQQPAGNAQCAVRQRRGGLQIVGDAPFDSGDLAETAVAGNVGGLRRPRRNRSRTRRHEDQGTRRLVRRERWSIAQQPHQHGLLRGIQRLLQAGEMDVLGINVHRPAEGTGQAIDELAQPEVGKGGGTTKNEHGPARFKAFSGETAMIHHAPRAQTENQALTRSWASSDSRWATDSDTAHSAARARSG